MHVATPSVLHPSSFDLALLSGANSNPSNSKAYPPLLSSRHERADPRTLSLEHALHRTRVFAFYRCKRAVRKSELGITVLVTNCPADSNWETRILLLPFRGRMKPGRA